MNGSNDTVRIAQFASYKAQKGYDDTVAYKTEKENRAPTRNTEFEKSGKRYKKVYVRVMVTVDTDGRILPAYIFWEDGHPYRIEKVKAAIPAVSTKVGGVGTRYTVIIGGYERYIFDEDGRWFVEVEEAE